ncbi:MAG: DMT family transporter [Dehalococcoidia bacterium]|nr:DMT family transporter [Dehalococcoidia bacterium]
MDKRSLLIGYGTGLLAAVLFGAVYVLIRVGFKDSSTPAVVGVTLSLFIGTVLFAPFGVARRNITLPSANRNSGMRFAIIAGVLAGVGQVVMYMALKISPAVVVSPIIHTQPLFTLAGAYVLLRGSEKLTWKLALGTLLVIAGVALITFGSEAN